jgi:transporter family protein
MYQLLGIVFGVVALVFYGVSDFYVVKASRRIGAFRTTLWFMTLNLLLLLALGTFLFKFQGVDLTTVMIVLITALISVIGWLSFANGLRVGNASIVGTVASGWAGVTVILGVLLLGESLTIYNVLAICLIIIGTMVISFDQNAIFKKRPKKIGSGISYALITLFSWGLFYFFITMLVNKVGWFSAALFVMMPTVAFLFIYGAATKQQMKPKEKDFPILLLVAATGLVAFLAYNVGVTYNYAAIVAPLTAAAPVVLILLALILLKEKLTTNQKLGIILVIIGIVWIAA